MRSLTFLAIGILGSMVHYSEVEKTKKHIKTKKSITKSDHLLIFIQQAAISQKKLEDMMKAIMDCGLKEQATHYDLDELFAHRPPSSKSGGCLHACIMQSFGLVSFIQHHVTRYHETIHLNIFLWISVREQ